MSGKKAIGPVNALYPSLTVLLGAEVDGRVNFATIAHVGILNHGQPQYLSFGVNKAHFTNAGIKEHKAFSVNIPGKDLMVQTDYAGLVSGANADKSGLFEVFYGQTAHAPLIKACPVCMECRLKDVLEYGKHDIFVGEIVETHADQAVLTEGRPDPAKVHPLLFDMATVQYYGLGPALGRCWSVGKALKK